MTQKTTLDVPRVPCAGVHPPNYPVAAKYAGRKRILGSERIC